MPTALVSICCREISQVKEKTDTEGIQCITLHPGFGGVWVLQTAFYSYHQQYGESAQQGNIHE